MKRVFLFVILAVLMSSVEVIAQCKTTESGTIVNATWTKDQSPYCIDGDIFVAGLTIEPGVVIEFLDNYVFEVAGVLKGLGQETDPVVFKRADTNATGWQGIFFNFSSPGSTLSYCVVDGSINSGIRIDNSSPSLRYCTIQNNSAARGGGININGSTYGIKNCQITNNSATGRFGGGIYAINGEVLIIDSVIENNSASGGNSVSGGGIYAEGILTLVNSAINENSTTSTTFGSPNGFGYGGGIYFSGSLFLSNSKVIENSVFVQTQSNIRSSNSYGGGIYANGKLVMTNSIVAANEVDGNRGGARQGGGFYLSAADAVSVLNGTVVDNIGEGVTNAAATLTAKNSIFWDNTVAQINGAGDVTYSDVKGGFTGVGNINFNPILTAAYRIVPGSLCIDAGDPAMTDNDVCVPPSLGSDRNDMGVDGGPQACNWIYKNGDYDRDCDADGSNLAQFITLFNDDDPAADLSNSGSVDSTDVAIFAARIGSASCFEYPSP